MVLGNDGCRVKVEILRVMRTDMRADNSSYRQVHDLQLLALVVELCFFYGYNGDVNSAKRMLLVPRISICMYSLTGRQYLLQPFTFRYLD